jgi:hypothetical protein
MHRASGKNQEHLSLEVFLRRFDVKCIDIQQVGILWSQVLEKL